MDAVQKTWLFGIILGIIGIVVGGGIFIAITLKTGMIIGFAAILVGAIAGGGFGLGYKLGNGKFKDKPDVQRFLAVATIFGLLGMFAAYFGPYIFLFAPKGINLALYLSAVGFGIRDILFIAIGAFGGRWAGKSLAKLIIMKQITEKAPDKFTEEIRKADRKLK